MLEGLVKLERKGAMERERERLYTTIFHPVGFSSASAGIFCCTNNVLWVMFSSPIGGRGQL